MDNNDNYWMQEAIALARQAAANKEVPVGAIVVQDNIIVGKGFNQPIGCCDPTAHAEILALRDAAKNLNSYRLVGASLYVTLEPCAMCAGAIVHSRVERLIFGAREPKAGVIVSQGALLSQPYINHHVLIEEGVLAEECGGLLREFFAKRRKERRSNKI